MAKTPHLAHQTNWRQRLHEVIFEADTPAGKAFDVALLWLIVASVVVVTMTTVGYGDIAPHTVPGQTLAAAVMVLGYSIITVPTGILSAELSEAKRKGPVSTQACPNCSAGGHDWDARHCKYCGVPLDE